MRKLYVLVLKEMRLTFRDVGALLTMIATPLVLSLAVAAAFGGGDNGGISDLTVLLLNEDTGPMGANFVDSLNSEALADLLSPQLAAEKEAARAQVDANQAVALIHVPADFSSRLLAQTDPQSAPTVVEIYANPKRPISVFVVRSIIAQFLGRANILSLGMQLFAEQIAESMDAAQVEAVMQTVQQNVAANQRDSTIRLNVVSASGRAFNFLDYFAPSMAILFVMLATITGGRGLVAERQEGTLPRLLVTPTRATTILAGKMAGVLISGVIQVWVLWAITSLIGVYWGAPLPVAVGSVMLVLCATGLSALVAAWSRTPAQVGAVGTALVLTASAFSGNFLPRMNLPGWMQSLSLVTPNAWGVELFMELQGGGALPDILPMLQGMLLLTSVYYAIATVGFRRQFA